METSKCVGQDSFVPSKHSPLLCVSVYKISRVEVLKRNERMIRSGEFYFSRIHPKIEFQSLCIRLTAF